MTSLQDQEERKIQAVRDQALKQQWPQLLTQREQLCKINPRQINLCFAMFKEYFPQKSNAF